jgi:hypothetical protein
VCAYVRNQEMTRRHILQGGTPGVVRQCGAGSWGKCADLSSPEGFSGQSDPNSRGRLREKLHQRKITAGYAAASNVGSGGRSPDSPAQPHSQVHTPRPGMY